MMAIVEKDDSIQIERLETAPFGTNAYILVCRATGDSVLIDAPGEAAMIAEQLKNCYGEKIDHKMSPRTATFQKKKELILFQYPLTLKFPLFYY